MEEPDHGHAHPHHRTGFRWLDISLALSAFCVSLSTLWLTMHNARTMERLVAANSYPNIDFSYGNQFDFQDGKGMRHAIYLSLDNTGIGPARLETVRDRIGIRVCYCSVFDECYLRVSGHREPKRVDSCPTPAVAYVGG